MIGTDSLVINPVTLVVDNVVGLYHPWTLSPKMIQILLCLCTVDFRLLLMMMMFLIEISEYVDDVSDRNIRV